MKKKLVTGSLLLGFIGACAGGLALAKDDPGQQTNPSPGPSTEPTTPVATATPITNGCTLAGWTGEGYLVKVYTCTIGGQTCVLAAGNTTELKCAGGS